MRLSARQLEVLGVIAEFGSECWGDVWTHCEWPGGPLAFRNFDRVANALVRNGLVVEGEILELTERGRLAIRLDAANLLRRG
jgi:hypothetical protein